MYEKKSDLPESLREYLPENLQEIYLDAYRRAWDEYEEYRGGEADREAVAHRDAMHAVEREHEYSEETGEWYPKGEAPTEEEIEAQKGEGVLEQLREVIDDVLP